MRKDDIQETLDYERFHRLPHGLNRELDYRHTSIMRQSVSLHGNNRLVIIVKTDVIDGVMREYIADGQHLFEALVTLGKHIVFKHQIVGTKEQLVKFLTDMNNTSKPWTLMDYIKAWAELTEDYKHLYRSINRYGIKPQGIAMVAMNLPNRASIARLIKLGRYHIVDRSRFRTMMNHIVDLLSIPELGHAATGYLPNRLIAAFIRFYNSTQDYNHFVIKQRLTENADIIRGAYSAVNELETILEERIFYLE